MPTKSEKNALAIEAFQAERGAYNNNGLLWTNYCKATCEYAGLERSLTVTVWIRYAGKTYENLELHGFRMEGDESNTVFSAKQATFKYENSVLEIHGTRKGSYYKISIGEQDREYINRLEA